MQQRPCDDDLALSPPYDAALDEALAYIHRRYRPLGIVVSGTIVRGTPDPSSDLDIVVAHERPWRHRNQRRFHGVPAEIFVNPPFQIRRAFAREAAGGRPVMAHMVATGVILHDPAGIMAELQREASDVLAHPPRLIDEQRTQARYLIATMFEDALELRERDPDRAGTLAIEAMVEAIRLHFRQSGRWRPREKELFTALDAFDPALGALARQAARATTLDDRLAAAGALIDRVTGATGFFPWESAPEPLTPDDA